MATIRKEIDIDAPIQQVFDACANPDALVRFAPRAVAVTHDHFGERRVGQTFKVTYNLLGASHDQVFTYQEYSRPHELAVQFDGDPSGTTRCILTDIDGATHLALETSYAAPDGAVRRKLHDLFLKRMYQRDAERLLNNLKLMLEQDAMEQRAA